MPPSSSGKQHRLMALVATNPKAAKRLKIPQSVGADFMKADRGKTFKKKAGGEVKKSKTKLFAGTESNKEEVAEARAIKSGKISPQEYAKREKSEPDEKEMKKGGKCYKKGGKVKCMQDGGGVPMGAAPVPAAVPPPSAVYPAYKKGGKCMQTGGAVAPVARPVVRPTVVPVARPVVRTMKSGGSCTRGDGIAQRGRTRGKYI